LASLLSGLKPVAKHPKNDVITPFESSFWRIPLYL
jgi:hypothetical protein